MAGKKGFLPDQALKKAMDLFWEQGYEGSSIEDLLECTGLGRGSLYATFGDKHSLYLAALDRYCANAHETMAAFLWQPGSPRKALEDLFQNYIDALLSDPARRGCFLVNAHIELAPHDPEVLQRVLAADYDAEEVLVSLLGRAQATGELAQTKNTQQLAHFLLGVLISIRVFARAKADRAILQDVAQTALSVLQ